MVLGVDAFIREFLLGSIRECSRMASEAGVVERLPHLWVRHREGYHSWASVGHLFHHLSVWLAWASSLHGGLRVVGHKWCLQAPREASRRQKVKVVSMKALVLKLPRSLPPDSVDQGHHRLCPD